MGKKKRDSNRHKKWEQRQAGASDPNNEEAITKPFMDALRHGMSENAFNFSKAVGVRPADLRAIKSGREKADTEMQAKIMGAAKQMGWAPPTQQMQG